MWVTASIASLFAISVFLFIFGESKMFRGTFIHQAYILLTEILPQKAYRLLGYVIGPVLMGHLERWTNSLFYKKHPLMQGFYLFLVTGCICLFLIFGWPKAPNAYVTPLDQFFFVAVSAFTYFAFFRACWSDPGIVTIHNAEKVNRLFDHDYLIFSPKMCSTCLIDKPARSKHCSLCNACIAKADHHCAWINNCVGHNNYRYFLLFLVATWTMCFYMTYIVIRTMQNEMHVRSVAHYLVLDQVTGKRRLITATESALYMAQAEPVLTALGAFAFLAGIIVVAFMCYQLYLVLSGRTANEAFKWDDLEYDIKHQLVTEISRSVLEYNQNYGKVSKPSDSPTLDEAAPPAKETAKGNMRRRNKKKTDTPDDTADAPDENIPFTSLKQVRNIYNRGVFQNLWDTLFPIPLG
ncbi:DHHC palmitoyltransferase-domain-containing protein [Obelidium mucronatum]|nr:DHHC palmitoyltransferase-domain-containing protein [Obelidium mucronatum]